MIVVAVITLAGAVSARAEVTGASENLRTGWYQDEPSLTPAVLEGGSFEQVFKTPLQGQIYAQPLTANGTLLVATEDNWVYGLDPTSGEVRWKEQFGTPVEAGISKTVSCTDLVPHIGITGTPVIDTEHGIAYFVSNRYISGSSGPIAWYMHAVELASGKEVTNFPVEIKGEAQNLPGVKFEPVQELQRPALLMMNGVVYAAFGSHCDDAPYEGWVAGVSSSGQLVTLWATGKEAGSIWQAGGGLISDGPGQILFSTGNGNGAAGNDPPAGPGGASTPSSGLGQSVVRVEVQAGGVVKPTDFFSPFENLAEDQSDLDLGSSAPIALPSPYFGTARVPHLLVQSGKTGYVYLLNRDNLGGMGQGPSGTDKVLQRLGPYGGVWDGAAVWPGDGGYVYIPAVAPAGDNSGSGNSDHLRFFRYEVNGAGEPALSLAATSPNEFSFGSGSPIVTSNATASGTAILWITRCPTTCAGADLRAYSPVPVAGSPHVLWEAPIGTANKFSRPDASNGHVYVGNREGDVFGYSGPALTPSTTSLDLGAGPVKDRLTGEVAFTNTGTKLTVNAVRLPSGPFEATGLPAVGTVIEPGRVITVGVAFESSAAGSFAGSLGLTTAAGETDIALSGSTVAPTTLPQQGGQSLVSSLGGLPLQEHKPAPDAKLASTSLAVSSSGIVTVKVTCPAGESSCTGTITLRTLTAVIASATGHQSKKPKPAILTLAVGSFKVAGGQTTIVKLHLSAQARKLLARVHVLHARATIVAHDATGATHTLQTIVTIRVVKPAQGRKP